MKTVRLKNKLTPGKKRKILILGGDGYLGWPTAMHFSALGYEVAIADNLSKRLWEAEYDAQPLWQIPSIRRRGQLWKKISGKDIKIYIGDIANNHRFVYEMFREFQPDSIIHYAEQPSAPFSMHSREKAVFTQHNNIIGNLNVLFAMQKYCPDAHLVKLGTMGEYGTPNITIEEGWLEVKHGGRKDRMLYPKRAGSFYHLTKVHDSNNIEFAVRIWKLRATDLNQGVVYGIDTPETLLDTELMTSFHYDEVFGTVLNRFIAQAVVGFPLTVYGKGGQKRGFLNIKDTIQCVELAIKNPALPGDFRVFNQFTELFTVNDLAQKVCQASKKLGLNVKIHAIDNPRIEQEDHFYKAKNSALLSLGLKPNFLTEATLIVMLQKVIAMKDHINKSVIKPSIRWKIR
ncbi:MAG: NAD-dependent epimerase/dehydratase family protein [Candidatus Paceibacterota bacterium]|jgi:UDP-sulfoquinovose synthase